MEHYYKSTVEEYVERRRSHLERLRDEGIFTQKEVEKELEDFRRGVEAEFSPNKIYGMLVMEMDAAKHKTDDSNIYISLTDIAKMKDPKNPSYLIQGWLRDKNTIRILYLWENDHNPDFQSHGYGKIKGRLSDPSFTLTVKIWKEATNAIGIISKPGNGGGTLAQRDIAIDFYAWLFPDKRYELVKVISGKAAFFETIQGEVNQMKIILHDND